MLEPPPGPELIGIVAVELGRAIERGKRQSHRRAGRNMEHFGVGAVAKGEGARERDDRLARALAEDRVDGRDQSQSLALQNQPG